MFEIRVYSGRPENEKLNDSHIFEKFKSGFKSLHSTQTSLVRVLNYILMTGASAVLVMLDLSSAFDTVDHEILVWRLMWDWGG